jgi:SAM-dependent methyltransferase
MTLKHPVQAIARGRDAVRKHGLAQVPRLALGRVVSFARRRHRYFQEWRFDRRHNIHTRGIVRGVGNEHSVQYQPLHSEQDFEMALRHVDCAGRVFVDVGCGRGRVLYLARDRGFARVVGVDIDESLAMDAQRNAPYAEVVVEDAVTYQFPAPPLLVYFNNPFDGMVLRRVFENLPSGDVTIIYHSPWHREAVDGMFPVIAEDKTYVVYDARNPARRGPRQPS